MNLDHFGMDTITLAGPLEAKLAAMRAAGFTQVMLNTRDLAEHPGGAPAACEAVRRSGLRVTGFQVLRDFEGLSGHLHAYKVDIAKAMLEMCHGLGSRLLLACSSTSAHATGEFEALKSDLQKLAMLAVPFGIRIAYEALSWGRHVNEFTQAWDIVAEADRGAAILLHCGPVAESPERSVVRVLLAQPGMPLLRRAQLEMEPHLLVHLAIVARTKEIIAHAQPKSAKPCDHDRFSYPVRLAA